MAERVIHVLDRISARQGYPNRIRVDNDWEFVSAMIAEWTQARGVTLQFIQPGKPTQNAYIERFNRSFREEALNYYDFDTLT